MSSLPANLLAASESHIDEGTPTTQPKTFMPTRQQFERIIRAARVALSGGPLDELQAALDSINIDV